MKQQSRPVAQRLFQHIIPKWEEVKQIPTRLLKEPASSLMQEDIDQTEREVLNLVTVEETMEALVLAMEHLRLLCESHCAPWVTARAVVRMSCIYHRFGQLAPDLAGLDRRERVE